MEIMKRLVREEEGQGMVEYGLIIGLISIGVIAFLPGIGSKLADFFEVIETKLEAVTVPD